MKPGICSRASLAAVFVLSLLPATSSAEFYSGNRLLEFLERNADPQDTSHRGGIGMGYVIGVADTLFAAGIICTPREATTGQMAAIVLKYLRQNPETLHQTAESLTYAALHQAFACKK